MKKRKDGQRMSGMGRLAVFLVLCLLVCGAVGAGDVSGVYTVMAAQKEKGAFGLSETSLSLYVGNTYQLETVNGEPVTDAYGWTYWVSFYSSDQNVVRVDSQSGLLRAVGVGQADITAYYLEQSVTCHVKVKAGNSKLDKEKLTLYEGQETTVSLTNSKHKAAAYEFFVYEKEGNYENAWGLAVESKGKGVFSVKGLEAGVYSLDLSLTNKKGASHSARCEVEVLECGFESNNIAVAEGGTVQFGAANGEILSCVIKDERVIGMNGYLDEFPFWDTEGTSQDTGGGQNVPESQDGSGNQSAGDVKNDAENPAQQKVKVDEGGKLTGICEGETFLAVKWRTAYGEERRDWLNVYVTKPEYVPFEGKLFARDWYDPEFEGISFCSKMTVASSNDKVIEAINFSDGGCRVIPQKAGKATLTFTVDGIQFRQKVQVIDPKWEQDCALVVKGKSKTLILSDVPKDCKVTWETSNKKIVTVSDSGKITGKKAGIAQVTATLLGRSFYCTVTVGSNKGLTAAVKGEAALGAVYSQEKRMQKGYYDCSSFVWRSYDAAGVKLGGVNYAPTAAELAKMMEKEKKVIAYEYIDADELKPGDLIFYAGGNNGRYKNIDHVAMYYGAYYSWGNENSGVIIHAAGPGVLMELYSWYRTGGIVMIARPVQ